MSTVKQLKNGLRRDVDGFRVGTVTAETMNRRWASPFVGPPLADPDGANVFVKVGDVFGAVVGFYTAFRYGRVTYLPLGGGRLQAMSVDDLVGDAVELYVGGAADAEPMFKILMTQPIATFPPIGTGSNPFDDVEDGVSIRFGDTTRAGASMDLIDVYVDGDEYYGLPIEGQIDRVAMRNLPPEGGAFINVPVRFRPQFATGFDQQPWKRLSDTAARLVRRVGYDGLSYSWRGAPAEPSRAYESLVRYASGKADADVTPQLVSAAFGGLQAPRAVPPVVRALRARRPGPSGPGAVPGGRPPRSPQKALIVQPANPSLSGPVEAVRRSAALGLLGPIAATPANVPPVRFKTFGAPVAFEVYVDGVLFADATAPLRPIPGLGLGVVLERRTGERLWLANTAQPHGQRMPVLIRTSGPIVYRVGGQSRAASYVLVDGTSRIDTPGVRALIRAAPSGLPGTAAVTFLAVA